MKIKISALYGYEEWTAFVETDDNPEDIFKKEMLKKSFWQITETDTEYIVHFSLCEIFQQSYNYPKEDSPEEEHIDGLFEEWVLGLGEWDII